MDFSEAYQFSGPSPTFSPNGKFIACAVASKCVIRDSETLIVYHMFSCSESVEHLEWSPSGRHVLCAMYNRSTIQVWDIEDSAWTCKIDEGPAGLVRAMWSSTGQDIITVAEFNLRLSVWDLHSQNCNYRQGPKHADKGIQYSKSGKHLAVLERVNLKDYIAIYTEGAPSSSEASRRFRISTSDAEDLAWSPDGAHLAVWDSPLSYNVLVYKPDGSCLVQYSAYDKGLGVRNVKWNASGQFLAIGSYDQVVRVLNHVTWGECAAFEHSPKVSCSSTVAFAEVRDTDAASGGSFLEDAEQMGDTGNAARNGGSRAAGGGRWRYEVQETPVEVPTTTPPSNKANPAMGVHDLCMSASGRFLATVNDAQRSALWLWDLQELSLVCLLQHALPITDFQWDPQQDKLAVCTAGRRLHLWTPDGASCVHTPLPNVKSRAVAWRTDGLAAAVCDTDRFCIAYAA